MRLCHLFTLILLYHHNNRLADFFRHLGVYRHISYILQFSFIDTFIAGRDRHRMKFLLPALNMISFLKWNYIFYWINQHFKDQQALHVTKTFIRQNVCSEHLKSFIPQLFCKLKLSMIHRCLCGPGCVVHSC